MRDVTIILVEPSGEEFTSEEQAYAIQSVDDAFKFWKLPYRIKEVKFLIPDTDPTQNVLYEWCNCSFTQETETELTIFIVDTRRPFFGYAAGYAQDYLGIIVVGMSAPLAPNIAHEMCHVYYHLPDLYLTGNCSLDIMCSPVEAYQRGFIGCISLAYMGSPCNYVYLPEVEKP